MVSHFRFRYPKHTTVSIGPMGELRDLEEHIVAANVASGIHVEGARNDGDFRTVVVRCTTPEEVDALELRCAGLRQYYTVNR